MGNKINQNAQSSADNGQADQADKAMNVAEAGLLNKQQELKELEDSLTQREKIIAQMEEALKITKDAIAKKEAELNGKRVQLEEMELQAKNGFPKLFEEKFAAFKKQLEQREEQCVGDLESLGFWLGVCFSGCQYGCHHHRRKLWHSSGTGRNLCT